MHMHVHTHMDMDMHMHMHMHMHMLCMCGWLLTGHAARAPLRNVPRREVPWRMAALWPPWPPSAKMPLCAALASVLLANFLRWPG